MFHWSTRTFRFLRISQAHYAQGLGFRVAGFGGLGLWV